MIVTWVLEVGVFEDRALHEMIAYLTSTRRPFHTVRVTPFSHEPMTPVPEISGPCVAYGSIGVQELARQRHWIPGVWTGDQFNPSNYAEKLGGLFLNHELVRCRLSEVAATAASLGWPQFFIRPNADSKAFAGALVLAGEIAQWVRQLEEGGLLAENDVEVVLAPPQTTGREWRTISVGGRVVAGSLYRRFGIRWDEAGISDEALATVQQAIEMFQPADVFAIDVCETPTGMKIIEYNTFNSAGLYACDTRVIIDEVSRWVSERY